MEREDIFKTVDHTLLAQTATWEEIKEICDDAIKRVMIQLLSHYVSSVRPRQQLGKKLKKYVMMRSNTRQHLYVFQHLM